MFSGNRAVLGRIVLLRSWHMRQTICTCSCEFVLIQFYSVSSNTAGERFLLYQCVQLFIHLSQLPFQDRKFRYDITKTAFGFCPSSSSSIITQAISVLSRFSLWNRPRNVLGDRKWLIRFWVI